MVRQLKLWWLIIVGVLLVCCVNLFIVLMHPSSERPDLPRWPTLSMWKPPVIPYRSIRSDQIPVVMCSDSFASTAVVINSTIENSHSAHRVALYIITSEAALTTMTELLQLFPSLHSFRVHVYNGAYLEALSQHLSYNSSSKYVNPLNFARFVIHDIFPHLRRYIFLDHDLVVRGDIAELWDYSLGGHAVAGVEICDVRVREMFTRNPAAVDRVWKRMYPSRALNWSECIPIAGVSVIDTQEWQRNNLTQEIITWVLEHHKEPMWNLGTLPPFILSILGRFRKIPIEWNVEGLAWKAEIGNGLNQIPHELLLRGKVLHFNGLWKPWRPCGWRRALWLQYYGRTYTIPPADTINVSSVARQMGMSEKELRRWNAIDADCGFASGTVVLLPLVP